MAWSKVTSMGATPNAGGITVACPNVSTQSSVFEEFGVPIPFTKLHPGTVLTVTMSAPAEYTSGGGATVQFGISVDGGLTAPLARFPLKSRSVTFMVSGVARLPGLAVGTRSVQPMWRRDAGSSSISVDSSMDYSVQIVEETAG